MKKVLILGATGSLASYVIDAAEQLKDVELTLLARNTQRLHAEYGSRHTLVDGDALNYQEVKDAVTGQDIVYVNLAGDLGFMGENIVTAMKEANVKRIIAICSIGIYDRPLPAILSPYRELADVIEASDLDYTILRPDWFTYDDEINYALTRKGEPESGTALSRRSIADFVSQLFDHPETYVKENLGISKPV